MVIAYHLVWTAYGTWLPNDPRGSGSRRVFSPQLTELGELHLGRRKVQPAPKRVREFHSRAEERLKFSAIQFDSAQIELIAAAFADAIAEHCYTCYACAIMPDHVHVVIRKHKHQAEQMIDQFQQASRLRLSKLDSIPRGHPIWTHGGWRTFLNEPPAVAAVIRYVEQNPIRAKLPQQRWPFHKQNPK